MLPVVAQNVSKSLLDFMEGKNVLVFDTETTGLPERGPFGFGSYYPYYETAMYKNSRIVSIAWSFIPNFNINNIDSTNIKHFLRKPEDFNEIPNSHIHGITFDDAMQNGFPLLDILNNKGLGDAIKSADYIVAHNAKFDYHVLQSDLYRMMEDNEAVSEIIFHLRDIESQSRLICTAEMGKTVCKLPYKSGLCSVKSGSFRNQKVTYKMPKLIEMYQHFYGCLFENQHNASADVWALLEIMKRL
jgi:DNA polymerase III epsilon subunit-like protein